MVAVMYIWLVLKGAASSSSICVIGRSKMGDRQSKASATAEDSSLESSAVKEHLWQRCQRWVRSKFSAERTVDTIDKKVGYRLGINTDHHLHGVTFHELKLTFNRETYLCVALFALAFMWRNRRQPKALVATGMPTKRGSLQRVGIQTLVQQQPLGKVRAKWFVGGTMFGHFMCFCAEEVEKSINSSEDEPPEDESLIKGSRQASIDVKVAPKLHDLIARDSGEIDLGSVELGGVLWRVSARQRDHRDKIGFYLNHRSGTRDQIAFSIKIVETHNGQVLQEERHEGNWVMLRVPPFNFGVASDGKGACVRAAQLAQVQSLRIEFTAHGPATKYKNAI